MKLHKQIVLACLFVIVVALPLLSQLLKTEKPFASRKTFPNKHVDRQESFSQKNDIDLHKLTDKQTRRELRLPQVIGIGVKKCSSTAMHFYLCSHPKLKCSTNELRFFNHDAEFVQGLDYYKSMFPARKVDEIGYEKTPQYLTMKSVPRRIKETYTKMNQSVKFILSICDPTLRTYSDHQHMIAHWDDLVKQQKRVNQNGFDFSFDEYIEQKLPEFKQFLQNDGLAKLESYNDSSYKAFHGLWKHFLTGIYSYHLRRWFKLFSKDDILIVDGDLLISKPWLVMGKVQNFLQISQFLKQENFVLNPKTGFYCLKINYTQKCMGKAKGRTRILTNDAKVTSRISENAKKTLQNFYHPYNIDLLNLTNQTFDWAT